MVSAISENFIIKPGICSNYTYTNNRMDNKSKLSEENIENASKNYKKKIIPTGLIVGGGLLLYYGVAKPGKSKLFAQYAKNKEFKMELIANNFAETVKSLFSDSSEKITSKILGYKKSHTINSSDYVIHINKLDDPKKIIIAQDLAFDTIASILNKLKHMGASDFDEVAVFINSSKREAVELLNKEKQCTLLKLKDCMHLPEGKKKFNPNLVEESENNLINKYQMLSSYIDKLLDERSNTVYISHYKTMADSIVEFRINTMKTKEGIIDAAYQRINKILNLDTPFIPSYKKALYSLDLPNSEIEKILKPQKNLPSGITKQTKSNYYLDIVINYDLNNLSKEDLRKIFYSMPFDDSLKDLRYLIDRLRLKQIIDCIGMPKKALGYEKIINKLKYLSNQLFDYSKENLLRNCDRDFDKMNVSQKHSALYYISRVSRRMGYESIIAMDKDMAKSSDAYRNFSIRKYIDIIKERPDLYFI